MVIEYSEILRCISVYITDLGLYSPQFQKKQKTKKPIKVLILALGSCNVKDEDECN